MVEYKWYISSLEAKPSFEGKQKVVHTIHWRLMGKETVDDKTYIAEVYGATNVDYEENENFIEYDDLSEENVVEWVKSKLGTETVQNNETFVANNIELQKNPPSISPPLPWTVNQQ